MRLFSLSGIEVRVDRTFWLLPAALSIWVGYQNGPAAALRMFVLVLAVFACVLGHEFTHALRARALGVGVPVITLYPIGGIASMMRIPKDPWQEFSIAAVGPLFNFGFAAVLFFPMHAWLGKDLFTPGLESWPRMLAYVFWTNPVLGAFNLIPAFPMDGGRMLRALLASKLKYVRATRISVYFGRIFAILFFLLGIWQSHWMLALVGAYVFVAGTNELKQVLSERA